jgi:hypothetical protein
MAKLLGHDIINAEEFGQFVDGEYQIFKAAVQNAAEAHATLLTNVAITAEQHKKELRFLKIALAVVLAISVVSIFLVLKH